MIKIIAKCTDIQTIRNYLEWVQIALIMQWAGNSMVAVTLNIF